MAGRGGCRNRQWGRSTVISSHTAGGKRHRQYGDPVQPIRRRIRELEALARHRPITKGCRHYFLLYYVTDLIRLQLHARVQPRERVANALEQARVMNRLFDPPLHDAKVRSLASVDASFSRRQRNTTVAVALRVTKAEVLALGLVSTVPTEIARQRPNDYGRLSAAVSY